MTEAHSRMLRIVVSLVPDVEPIQGHACGADRVVHPFTGWLELVEVLDQARMSRPPPSRR